MKETDLNSFFTTIGFGFPENSDQLNNFNNVLKDYQFESNENSIDPEKILKSVIKSNIQITQVDYHKRTVLAAEIVYQLRDEWSMGHLKLQKLIYLCQNTTKMSLHVNFLKQAMGPYDPALMRSLDKQFKQHKWFEFKKDKSPKYHLLENAGGHREWFLIYYKDNLHEIEFIIDTFRSMKTPQVELIATIYACWLEIIEKKEVHSHNLIIDKVYAWSEEKEKFSEKEILNSISWMMEKGIHPN